jgi:hypothetical protein
MPKKGLFLILLSLIILSGCRRDELRPTLPHQKFPVSFNILFHITLRILQENEEPILTTDRESGLIVTEWVTEEWGFSRERHKFNILITKLSKKEASIRICAFEERWEKGFDGNYIWVRKYTQFHATRLLNRIKQEVKKYLEKTSRPR